MAAVRLQTRKQQLRPALQPKRSGSRRRAELRRPFAQARRISIRQHAALFNQRPHAMLLKIAQRFSACGARNDKRSDKEGNPSLHGAVMGGFRFFSQRPDSADTQRSG
jgi:hypothetical protein